MSNPYNTDLDRNPANYQPLTPLSFLERAADVYPEHTAIIHGSIKRSYLEFYKRSLRLASALSKQGIVKGDTVSVILPNTPAMLESHYGVPMCGAVLHSINTRLDPETIAYQLDHSNSKALIVDREFLKTAKSALKIAKASPILIDYNDSEYPISDSLPNATEYESFLLEGNESFEWVMPEDEWDAISLNYTSGTTGLPKGAQLTNDNFQALFKVVKWQMTDDSRNMVVMPLFHIAGSGWALFGMGCGATSIMMRDFDPVPALQLIESEKATHAIFVPAILGFFLLVPSEGIDLSSMELIAYGASPITQDVLVKSMEQFGCQYMQVYGLSETTGAVTQLDPEDHDPGGPREHLLRSAGKAIEGVELKIVDEETGESLPDGEVGEVWIKGNQNMVGYWKLPEATAEALPGGGWFRSGDAAYIEDGYLFIHDRVKDMIISGGENVYPAEIENALMGHEAIADVGVIGVPDDKWGEVGKAMVVVAPGSEVTEEEIIAFARERLAGFKCPQTVDFVEALPRNPSGKILKRELRDPFWEGRERQV